MTANSHDSPPASIPAEVAQRAVEWLVELQSDHVSPAVQANWQAWRLAHPDHELAWRHIEAMEGQIFGKLRHLASPVKSAMAQASLTPPRSLARRRAITTLAVMLFAGGAAWSVRQDGRWSTFVADYGTATGERRTVVLDDGSTLELNTASAVNVAFSETERRVRLVAGEVLITTASDKAARPFLIETAQGEAEALGTQYIVRLHEATSDVAVFEGAVRLTPREASARPHLLQAGRRARFNTHAVTAEQMADRDSAAWTDGIIVAKGMRLADFLTELARYSQRPLWCDPAVADLRISGSYPLADIDKVLDTLSAMLSLQVETVTRFWGLQTVRVQLGPRRPA
ncbi:FecR domain-containing protein [Hydrogenophaga sp. BPS33]|uniref:FecR domain-containing protein n=1 Tax=Hydrogenophaga sp. BPS33 TaxID=2651974 RepID=UPI00131F6FD3|nr:FecR family protein [Hydrogenophaga sp. BPS33]QHE87157.1 FecR family protein [Hydrogenophaga sp. BPS33]